MSPTLQPSPYSPLHVPSRMPGAFAPDDPPRTARRSRSGRLVALGIVAALAVAVAGIVTVAQRPSDAPAVKPSAAPAAPALTDEAARLARSAIAVFRYTPPRRS